MGVDNCLTAYGDLWVPKLFYANLWVPMRAYGHLRMPE